MVKYKQEELQDELDDEQMQEFATVHSYLGTALFDNATLAGKKFADFNTAELKDDQSWSWEVNTLESLGFTQSYDADQNVSEVNCAVTSARTTTATNHDYKVGTTMKVRGGYKIRSAKDSTTSLFAKDNEAQDFTLVIADGANYLLSSASAIILASLLSFA